jgi:hypothetical protein
MSGGETYQRVSRARRSTKRGEAERSGALQNRDRQGKDPFVAVPDQQCTASRIWKDRARAAGAALHPGHESPINETGL